MVVICMSSAALAAEDPVVEESDRYVIMKFIYSILSLSIVSCKTIWCESFFA